MIGLADSPMKCTSNDGYTSLDVQSSLIIIIDDIWSADLVDMQIFSKYNKNFKFLLTVIDLFSRYAWIVPLKNKKVQA